MPDIAGLDQDFVVSSDDVMSGSVTCHGHVVLIDSNGHWEAAGTAEFLADAGCSVTVVANHAVGSDLEAGTRTLFYRRAAIKNMMLRSACCSVSIIARVWELSNWNTREIEGKPLNIREQ